MLREKQIEELGKILCGMKNGCDGCMWDKVHCNERNYAEEIYNAGYRKQSEVAKEIFDEIEKLVSTNKKTVACATYEETIFYIEDFIEDLAELKKKYTGEKEDKGEN